MNAGGGPPTLPEREEPPPILGRWRNLYAVVLGALIALIALCAWLTHRFA
jgi:hypothetical protein